MCFNVKGCNQKRCIQFIFCIVRNVFLFRFQQSWVWHPCSTHTTWHRNMVETAPPHGCAGALQNCISFLCQGSRSYLKINQKLIYDTQTIFKSLWTAHQHLKWLNVEPAMVQLTVVAQWPSVRRHATVAGEALPLLQAHPLVGARVLLARGAGACKHI